jgi:hypothetical protein
MEMQYTADAITKKEMSEDNREARLRLMCETFRKHVCEYLGTPCIRFG